MWVVAKRFVVSTFEMVDSMSKSVGIRGMNYNRKKKEKENKQVPRRMVCLEQSVLFERGDQNKGFVFWRGKF